MNAFDSLLELLPGSTLKPLEPGDWAAVLQFAERNKLVLPLAQSVANNEAVPKDVRERLSSEATRKSLVEIHRAGHLLELVADFQEAGIEVKSFKGPTLAQLAHGRVSARECCDIDLLVKPAHFDRALKRLFAQGFVYEMEDQPRCYTRFHYGVPLNNGPRRLTVDLHYELFSAGVHFPSDRIWDCPFHVEIQGVAVPTFRPEHIFVYLALHGSKHCWRELRWLHDLYVLLPQVDLGEVEAFARLQSCERSVALALGLLDELWSTGYSLSSVKADPSLLSQSLRLLQGARISWPEYHSYQYRCQSTWQQRFRLFLHTWFSPQIHDLRFVDLPPSLWFVYYAIRPIRVLGRRLIPLKGVSDD